MLSRDYRRLPSFRSQRLLARLYSSWWCSGLHEVDRHDFEDNVLAIYVLLILSARFVDWNSRKPFLRDLLQLKEGMTGQQVRDIMGRYQTQQDPTDVSQANDTICYVHSHNPSSTLTGDK